PKSQIMGGKSAMSGEVASLARVASRLHHKPFLARRSLCEGGYDAAIEAKSLRGQRPSDCSFQDSHHRIGQDKHRPGGSDDDDSKSDQLGEVVWLRPVGVSVGEETANADPCGCCACHSAPFTSSLKWTSVGSQALRRKSNAI